MRCKRYELCLTPPGPGATRARFSSVPAQNSPTSQTAGRRKGGVPPLISLLGEVAEGANGAPAEENEDPFSLVTSPGNLKLALARQSCSCSLKALNKCRFALPAPSRGRR